MRNDVGIFDVSHMGQVADQRPAGVRAPAAARLERRPPAPEGGAQYGLLCNEQGGVLDDLFIYRLGESRFLTVTNAANHARDLAWMQSPRRGVRRRRARPPGRLRDARRPGSARACARAGACRRPAAAAHALLRAHARRRAAAGLRHRLHRRGRRRAAARPRPRRRRCGRRWSRPARGRSGLGARDTLRLEACFHLYGNDSTRSATRSAPVSAGPAPRRLASSAPTRSRRFGSARPELKLVPFVIDGPGIARQGNAGHSAAAW